VLLARIGATVAPATERQGRYLAELLRPVAARLQRLTAALPPGIDAEQRGQLWHSLGLAAYRLGEQIGDQGWLKNAIAAYRAALQEWTRERLPLAWAMAQNNLGTALRALGAREGSPARLEEAALAFRPALQEYTR
jgi:tetratricopeptide (TPR) repeat protein